jgi:serine protease Do
MRNGNRKSAGFVVEEFSEEDMLRTRVVIYGIQIQNIDTQLAKKYRLAYSDGVVVTDVEANSVGDKLGIMPGDVVLMIGNVRIHNKTDFQKALRYQRDMSIIIDRNGRIIQLYLGV